MFYFSQAFENLYFIICLLSLLRLKTKDLCFRKPILLQFFDLQILRRFHQFDGASSLIKNSVLIFQFCIL